MNIRFWRICCKLPLYSPAVISSSPAFPGSDTNTKQSAVHVFVLPRRMLGRAGENVKIETRHFRSRRSSLWSLVLSQTFRNRKHYKFKMTAAWYLHTIVITVWMNIVWTNILISVTAEINHHIYRFAWTQYYMTHSCSEVKKRTTPCCSWTRKNNGTTSKQHKEDFIIFWDSKSHCISVATANALLLGRGKFHQTSQGSYTWNSNMVLQFCSRNDL